MNSALDKVGVYDFFGVLLSGMIVIVVSCCLDLPLINLIANVENDIVNAILFLVGSFFLGLVLQEISSVLDKKVFKFRENARCKFLNDENKIIEELKICEEEYHKKHAIIIVSEKILDVEKLANRISEETGYSGRSIVLGHIQRGGSPVPEDRILASKMAEEAICLLEKRKSGLCICMKDNQIISKNIEEALIEKNENHDRLYQLFLDLA